MPFTLTPDEAASFVPAAPANPEAAAPPEPLTPEELASFSPTAPASGGEPILKTFSVPQIVELVKQNPTFNLIAAFQDDPTTANDPEVWAKVKEAKHQIDQLSVFDTAPVLSGLAAGDAAKTWEGVKQVGSNVGGMVTGLAKWGANALSVPINAAANTVDEVLGIGDEKTRQAHWNENARRAVETIAGTETGVAGLAHMGSGVLQSAGRVTHLGKQFKDYTEADKQSALIEAVTQHNAMKDFSTGHGPLVDSIGRTLVADLAKKGFAVRPEKVAELASGDPVSFVLFGAGLEAGSGLAKAATSGALQATGQAERVAGLVSKLPDAADLSRQVGGRAIQGLGKTAEGATFVAEKSAPIAGAIAGSTVAAKIPFIGELPIPGAAHLMGALEGYHLGVKSAAKLHDIGASLKKISAAGENIAKDTITGSYEQLAKDVLEAAPGAAGAAAKGAAFDLALAATQDPNEQQGLGIGLAFGLLHGAAKLGGAVVSGQIVGPRAFPGSQTLRPPNEGANAVYAQLHNAAFGQLKPGQKAHVNAAQDFLAGLNPNADIFAVSDGAAFKDAVRKTNPTIPEETIDTWSQQRALTIPSNNGRKVIFLIDKPTGWKEGDPSGIAAAPHEVHHAIEDVLGADTMREISQSIQATRDIDGYGRDYVRNAFKVDPDKVDWRTTLVERNMRTQAAAAAAEKMIQTALATENDKARAAGNPLPSETEIRDLVAGSLAENPIDWRAELTPEEVADLANDYMAREIAAEHFDTLFKRTGASLTPGKQVPEVIARAVARLMTAAGANPLAGRVSEGLQYPLDPQTLKLVGEKAAAAKKLVEPVATPDIAAKLPSPPEARAQTAREVAAKAPAGVLPGAAQSQREILGTIAESIATGGAVKLDYLSAPSEAPGAAGEGPSASVYSDRETRRAVQEFYNAIDDPATRALWEKLVFADTVSLSKKGDFLIRGYSPEVLAANAQKIAAFALANPEFAKTLPTDFVLDADTGSFSKNTWLTIYQELQKYNLNHKAGLTGSGKPLVVPESAKKLGAFEGPVKRGQAEPVSTAHANFFNILYNFQRPKTGKLGGKAPNNYIGQLVSAATEPGRVSAVEGGEPTFIDPQNKYGVNSLPVLEVNPMRAAMEKAVGGRANMPSLIEAIQVLRADRILRADHAPEAGPSIKSDTLKLSAGFMPAEGKREIEIEGPDGKKYRAMFDGYQDFSQLGMGKMAQLTALEDLPGVTTAKSTTYARSLEKAGYKLPDLDNPPKESENFWGDEKPIPGEPTAQFLPPKKIPEKTVKVYKLFGTRKQQPGKIFPLFIGAKIPTPMGEWIAAENIPTKGFSNRPGWHVGMAPRADHLLTKDGKLAEGRVWAEAEIPADVDWQARADASPTKDIRDEVPEGGHYSFRRPARQGGEWKIAGAIKVNRILDAAEVDAINKGTGAEPSAQFRHSLGGIKKMNDEEVARQKRGAEGETTRMSSYTGDAESGVVIHSAKNRSTAFIRSGEPAKNFLAEISAAKGDAEQNAVIEANYANANFMPSSTGRKAKPDYKLREGPGMFSKAWILPDGTPVQLGGLWHHEWLNNNPDVIKKFGLSKITTEQENRIDALKKGFARINYEKNTGTLTVEARQKDWPNLRESVKEFARANLRKIDNMDVHLLNDKAGPKPVESEGVRLFTYDAHEKMDNLPLISAPPEVTEMSAQNHSALRSEHVQYMTGGDPRAIRQAAVKDPETGKIYEGYAHFAARQEAMQDGLTPADTMRLHDGFVTNTPGEFLDRTEAFKRAIELKQYKPAAPGTDLSRAQMDARRQLESQRFAHQQEMAKAGYEPDAQYTPRLPGKFEDKSFEKTLKDIRAGKLFGATFNTDGTTWEPKPTDRLDLVSLASLNVPQGKLNVAAVDKFLAPFEDLLDEDNIRLGAFSFSKDGVPMVSIDLNALVDQKHRANTVAFAKANDQVAIWDSHLGEEVKTGGKGNTRLKSLAELYEAHKPLSKGKPVDVLGIIADNAPNAAQTELGLPDESQSPSEYDRHAEANMTKRELAARHPESVQPPQRDAKIGAKITESPRYKAAGSHVAAVKSFAKGLVDFAKEYWDHPVFQDGIRWYSEVVPQLKTLFGEHAQLMAELIACTSPKLNPRQNYAFSVDALESAKAGKYDRQVAKYLEGLAKLETDAWKAGGAKTKAMFLDAWIAEHNLAPRQSNGMKFGLSSNAVLQVLARTWLTGERGLKTTQFVKNLLGIDHGATIDVWAGNRTMRRIGYSGYQDRWRILPKNETGISDVDFRFSQEAYAEAAKQLGLLPDALQGGLWFAEKQLWADRKYGSLDLGSFANEMKKTAELTKQVHERLKAATPEGKEAAAKKIAAAKAEKLRQQPEFFITPRPEK